MRATRSGSNTGNWDRDSDEYWTVHNCSLCGLMWHTGQGWERVGGKRGMPDDEAAQER